MTRTIIMCLLAMVPVMACAGESKATLPGGLQGVEGLLLYVVAEGNRDRVQRQDGRFVFATMGDLYLRTGENLEHIETSKSSVDVVGHDLFWCYEAKDAMGRRVRLSSHGQYWALSIDERCYLCTVVTTNAAATEDEKKRIIDALVVLVNEKPEIRRLFFDPTAEAVAAAAHINLPSK